MATNWLPTFGGVEVAACAESFKWKWGSPPCPARKPQKQGRLYNRKGNQLKGGRMAERSVVLMKPVQHKPVERRGRIDGYSFDKTGGKVVRTGATIGLQELRRKIYLAAKSDKHKRFWGLYCHIAKEEALLQAYKDAKANEGAAGIDGQTFAEIEQYGVEKFISELSMEMKNETYKPKKNRKVEIPKENGKVRQLGIPGIKDRVVQGAIKLILEPLFEADFSEHSFGYRPGRSQHQAVVRVAQGIKRGFTTVIDADLSAFFDNVDHEILMRKIRRRINDDKLLGLIGRILKASGKKGVAQGGVISPLFSNIYLTVIDRMFEKAIIQTERKGYQQLDYCRFADDIVIVVNGHPALEWLVKKSLRRLKEEMAKLKVNMNMEKTKIVDMNQDETFDFLGFTYRKVSMNTPKEMVSITPKKKKVQNLIAKVREHVRSSASMKVAEMVKGLNDILRGWVNYYRIGHSSRIFSKIRNWVERKVRRFVRKSQGRSGFGWKEWSKDVVYNKWGLYSDYKIRYYYPKAKPAQ
jgi:RNA-directed DNA polymerase